MSDQFNILGVGILSWVLWLPAVGALVLLFFNKEKKDSIRLFANVWIVLCFLVSLLLITGFVGHGGYDRSLGGLQFIEDHEWIPPLGARYQLGIDGLSLVLVMLTTLLGVISVVCSWSCIREKGREKQYYIMLLLLQTGMLGAFVSADLFLFFVFWEMMLVPVYFLIGIWGGANRLYSASKFILYTLLGSVLMLLAVMKLFFIFPQVVQKSGPDVEARARQLCSSPLTDALHVGRLNAPMLNMTMDAIKRARGIDASTGGPLPAGYINSSFNIPALTAVGPYVKGVLGLGLVIWLFAGFGISFAIRAPVFPFHTWLADAHYNAPTAGSVILAGILLKMGTYGFLRFALPMFPDAVNDPTVRQLIIILAIVGIVYGAFLAMAQKDIKKLIAYSSISQLGLVMLGLFALNPDGINGAVLQMINHGISTGGLFILAGILYERRRTFDISEFGGLFGVMPKFSVIFLIVTLSALGLPLLNNFRGELLTLTGAFEANASWGVWGMIGLVLVAAYLILLYRRVFLGRSTSPANESLKDIDARETWQFAPILILIFWIGVYPKPFLSYINPQTEAVVAQVNPDYFKANGEANKARTLGATSIGVVDGASANGNRPEGR